MGRAILVLALALGVSALDIHEADMLLTQKVHGSGSDFGSTNLGHLREGLRSTGQRFAMITAEMDVREPRVREGTDAFLFHIQDLQARGKLLADWSEQTEATYR